MTRIIAWLGGTLGTLFLLFGYHTSTSATLQAVGSASVVTGSAPSGAAGGSASGSGAGAGAGAASGSTSDGTSTAARTWTGAAVPTRYGPVQVEITVEDGSITTVSVLQYPHADGRDQQINGYALPQLIDETIAAQDARIDMVSGASYTSQGYLGSLQSALDQAGL